MPLDSSNIAQLRSLLSQFVKNPKARYIGLRVGEGWEGENRIECEGESFVVVRVNSVLAMRNELQEAAQRQERTVFMTSLEESELGADVIARLAKRKLHPLELWETVCGLFRAREIAPMVRNRSIARMLIDHAPINGYPPVPAGMLDSTTVWRNLFRHTLQIGNGDPNLADLIEWASTSVVGVERYRKADEELRSLVRRQLIDQTGAGADALLTIVETGWGRDALALAIVCDVLFAPGSSTEIQAAKVRMERYFGHQPIAEPAGIALAKSAGERIEELENKNTSDSLKVRQRADDLLREIGAIAFARRGRHTPSAWEQRLEDFARSLATDEYDQHRLLVESHTLADRDANDAVVERVRMATRLKRWQKHPPSVPESMAGLAKLYRDDLSHVDRAIDALTAGESLPSVTTAYRTLVERVREQRSKYDEAFAQFLSDEPSGVIPVENVIDEVIAPIVRNGHPILLIVLDGCSWAIAHDLLTQLRSEHWQELTLDESQEPPVPLLATIPSVTERSRVSLFAGKFHRGDASVEREVFSHQPKLLAECERRHPPILFHKAHVSEGSRGPLREELNEAIRDEKKKIVGVVINAIDDELAGAEQLHRAWSVETVRVLMPLMRTARESGRIIVFVSDHGHVWHRDDAIYRKAEHGGERWRTTPPKPEAGERQIEGPRVGDDRDQPSVIVPWDERIRYAVAKNGYHGGVSLREMLAILAIVVPSSTEPKKGLSLCQLPLPEWWVALPTPPRERPIEPPPKKRLKKGGSLFDEIASEAEPEKPSDSWIDALLKSPVYADQKSLASKHVPDEAKVRKYLTVLDQHGGTLTPEGLAHQTAEPMVRLSGLLSKLQRLLNVDGYEVLQIDRARNVVTLNIALLRRQFELE